MTVLYVCSGGGHLKGLHRMADRMPFADDDRRWVTFDTGLSRSLLADEDVTWATYAAPRDVVNIARNGVLAARMLRERRYRAVVSTGSSIAVDFLPLAAAKGIPSYFIESSARVVGPSLTGRILQHAPRVRTYTQHPAWASARWKYVGSIFDSFEPAPPVEAAPADEVVVSLGTTESYSFRRLLDRLVPLLDGRKVLWQTGSTDTSGLGVDAQPTVPFAQMAEALASCDVVVCHAGVGSALSAMEAGHCPVLVIRRKRYDEHVDDHQEQIAADLHRRGVAIACEVEDLTPELLAEAARRRVRRASSPPPLPLD